MVLPVPFLEVIAGGAHANNALDIQEFMIAPIGFRRYSEALRAGTEVYHAVRAELVERGLATGVGDSGGFAPSLAHSRETIELIMRAIARAGYATGTQIALALDAAATGFRSSGTYVMAHEGLDLSTDELIDYWALLADQYPLVLLEDGLAEDDWPGWAALTRRLGERVEVVGDDIFVTNPRILAEGIAARVGNSVAIKPNQVGTLTESMETIGVARRAGYGVVISGRSGETDDDFIADLAVATRAGRIKAGAPVRGEHVAKYNRLLAIERELGAAGSYAGHEFVR
jgi:enolase